MLKLEVNFQKNMSCILYFKLVIKVIFGYINEFMKIPPCTTWWILKQFLCPYNLN